MSNKNILVVDDDEKMLRALNKVLSSEGAVIATAKCAEDAIEILIRREERTNLVITDLRMPQVSGMTLAYAVHLMFPAVPVIVLTAFGNPELKAECIRQGAAGFLEKNLSTPELLGAIEEFFTTQSVGREQIVRACARKPAMNMARAKQGGGQPGSKNGEQEKRTAEGSRAVV